MATTVRMYGPILEATVYYRDETRDPDKYRNVEFISHDKDIAWLIQRVDGSGVWLAFSEVLKIEQTVQDGKQEIDSNDR